MPWMCTRMRTHIHMLSEGKKPENKNSLKCTQNIMQPVSVNTWAFKIRLAKALDRRIFCCLGGGQKFTLVELRGFWKIHPSIS